MHADLILVLDGGRVIQRGTHEQLVARAGLYQTLWRIQTELVDLASESSDADAAMSDRLTEGSSTAVLEVRDV